MIPSSLMYGDRLLWIAFLQLWVAFLQLRVGFLQLRTAFLQLRVGFLQLRLIFLQLRVGFLQLRTAFLQLRTIFLQLRTTFLQLKIICRLYVRAKTIVVGKSTSSYHGGFKCTKNTPFVRCSSNEWGAVGIVHLLRLPF